MGWIFLVWLILINIFRDYFWQVTISVVGVYAILKFIYGIIAKVLKQRAENKKYQGLLKEIIPTIHSINLEPYQNYLLELEKLYETSYSSHKIILKDKKENEINICPKCGGYMRIVKGWKGKFLRCSNYPDCRSTRNYSEILSIKF
jgi:hypothetical protein